MSQNICKNCGTVVPDGTHTCPGCGAAMGPVMGEVLTQTAANNIKSGDVNSRAQVFYANDNGSFGWMLLGMLIPLGLILFFVLRKKAPKRAQAILSGMIVAVIILVAVLSAPLLFPEL